MINQTPEKAEEGEISWISVKDRLPEIGAVVLAGKNTESVLVFVGRENFDPDILCSPRLTVFKCTYEHAGWSDEITHWMPLSEPPETTD